MVGTDTPTRTLNVQETRLTELLSDYVTKLVFVRSSIEKEGRISNSNRKLLFDYYRRINKEFLATRVPATLRKEAEGYLERIEGIERQWG